MGRSIRARYTGGGGAANRIRSLIYLIAAWMSAYIPFIGLDRLLLADATPAESKP